MEGDVERDIWEKKKKKDGQKRIDLRTQQTSNLANLDLQLT